MDVHSQLPTFAETTREISAAWKLIAADADQEYLQFLRSAANMVGFWKFPIGWSWQEIPPVTFRKKGEKIAGFQQRPYEAKFANIRWHSSGNPDAATEDGKAAQKRATHYRQDVAKNNLLRLINMKGIRHILRDMDDKERIFPANYVVSDLDLRTSSIVISDKRMGCSIDVLGVLEYIREQRSTEERNRKKQNQYNWFAIERYIRNIFETEGTAATNADFEDRVYNWHSKQSQSVDEEPTRSTLHDHLRLLRTEYDHPINKRPFKRTKMLTDFDQL